MIEYLASEKTKLNREKVSRAMDIGIAKEIGAAALERRAILLPREINKLAEAGHQVFVEKGLGKGIYINDSEYRQAGAEIVSERRNVFNKSIVVKLKPPLPQEFRLLKNNVLFSMLHAEQNPKYIKALRKSNVKAIAMEMIRNRSGERLIQCSGMSGEQGMIYAFYLAEKSPSDCNVLVLGYGAIATGALRVAFSLGAKVKILRKQEHSYVKQFIKDKDIVVNGIQWPKEKRERREYLITKEMFSLLSRGAVVLDLSVDYPNPIEPCHPSLLNEPVYEINGIKCVSIYGYPRLAPISSSRRYSKQVLPILLKVASTPLRELPRSIKNAIIDPDKY